MHESAGRLKCYKFRLAYQCASTTAIPKIRSSNPDNDAAFEQAIRASGANFEEFLYEGCRLMRDRLLAEDVWEAMGWPVAEVREIVLHSPQMVEFRKMLFSKIVPNVKRLGLLTPWVRERFAELDILQFEHLEASA